MSDLHPTTHSESFRPIPDFPGYWACEDGTIWSCRPTGRFNCDPVGPWRRKAPLFNSLRGYYYVRVFYGSSKGRIRPVHRLVLEAFVGPRPHGMAACHRNCNTADNSVANLRWDTYSANWIDSIAVGHDRKGTKHPLAKLTDDAVRAIRAEKDKTGRMPRGMNKHFAELYGVSQQAIVTVSNRRGWKHVQS